MLVVLGVFVLTPSLGPPRLASATSRSMQEKSEVSQQLFVALVQQDFAKVNLAAQRLAALAFSGSWPAVVSSDATLVQQRQQLAERAEALRQAAVSRSPDALPEFIDLARNCVGCHRMIESANTPGHFSCRTRGPF